MSAAGGGGKSSRVQYINQKMKPLLSEMSLQLLQQQPEDPENFLLRWLQMRTGSGDNTQAKLSASLDRALVSGELGSAINAVSNGKPGSQEWMEEKRKLIQTRMAERRLSGELTSILTSSLGDTDAENDALLEALGCKVEDFLALEIATPCKNLAIPAELQDLSFDCNSRRSPQADARLVVKAFRQPFDVVEKFQLDEEVLETFVMEVALKSPSNPYHNWAHAMNVLQFCHLSLASGIGALLTFADILSLLSSAIAASLGHPGTTNGFLVNTRGEIAMRYNDKSPIQNLCASMFFDLLLKPAMNYAKNMAALHFKAFRFKVIQAVLSTDMSQHFLLIDKLSSYMSQQKSNSTTNAKQESERTLLLQVVSHTSSLAYSCRPWSIHKLLVQALEEEFFSQGSQEKAAGLPISPNGWQSGFVSSDTRLLLAEIGLAANCTLQQHALCTRGIEH